MQNNSFLMAVVVTLFLGICALGQVPGSGAAGEAKPLAVQTPVSPDANAPFISELNGIRIGMTVDEIKDKLGKPQTADASGLYFEVSKGESVQIGLDPEKKARTIAFIYSGKEANAPEFAQVFGPNVAMVESSEGSVYKMERYPAAGYWVAYSRTSGKEAMTVITMRRMKTK